MKSQYGVFPLLALIHLVRFKMTRSQALERISSTKVFVLFAFFRRDISLFAMRIVIVYPHCHAEGEIEIARFVRPLKLKSAEGAEAQRSQ